MYAKAAEMKARLIFTGLGCYIYFRWMEVYEPSPSAAIRIVNYLNS